MRRLLWLKGLACYLTLCAGCGSYCERFSRCSTNHRRCEAETVPDCPTCDGGEEICVAREPEDIAEYDRAMATCRSADGGEWDSYSEICSCPQTPDGVLQEGSRSIVDGSCVSEADQCANDDGRWVPASAIRSYLATGWGRARCEDSETWNPQHSWDAEARECTATRYEFGHCE